METSIRIIGARSHNLKGVSCEIPRGKLTVITGVSGSGKSTLAFDTLFAEGQRRYVESLSTYARQFLERMSRPDVDLITGIPPAIAIVQKNSVKNARSTVGTTTEIYDYLRLLFAKIGDTICPDCDRIVGRDTVQSCVARAMADLRGERIYIISPLEVDSPERADFLKGELLREGFYRALNRLQVKEMKDIPSESLVSNGRIDVLIDRLSVAEGTESRLAESFQAAFALGHGQCEIVTTEGHRRHFNEQFICTGCGQSFPEPNPLLFSFNSPMGACQACQGFGRVIGIDMDKVIPDKMKSISERAIAPWTTPAYEEMFFCTLDSCKKFKIPARVPFAQLTDAQKDIIISGKGDYTGIKGFFDWLESKKYKVHVRVFLSKYRGYNRCQDCGGSRLKKEALRVKVGGENIAGLSNMSIDELKLYFDRLNLERKKEEIAERLLKEIKNRLAYMVDVGLGYITLQRQMRTVSGGEAQRISMAFALGSSLTETLYVLDEPTVGQHPRDAWRLLRVLKALRDNGNTIAVVEHDPDVISQADRIIDLGPGAGAQGGNIVYKGDYRGLLNEPGSITGHYLKTKKLSLALKGRRIPKGYLEIYGARHNNLKNIGVKIPLGLLCCVTGVSGAGKSTLVNNIIYAGYKRINDSRYEMGKFDSIAGADLIKDMIMVDQSPIGRSLRSNPVTYIKAFDKIRALFADTHEARRRGIRPGHFSFNVPGGRCEACQGAGLITVEMQFLEDVTIVCDKCEGKRFGRQILEIRYKDKNICEVLDMTVEEALDFFDEMDELKEKLSIYSEVGLGYLRLGQPTSTLSGGEAQRLKLASHIASSEGAKDLFILDEPTTGLHMADVDVLLKALEKLLAAGNSLLVVEHNLDLINNADYIIDLGPEGGDQGGCIVAQGTPEEVMAEEASFTGRYLKARLSGS